VKTKLAKPDAYINGGVLMTADEIVARAKVKEEVKLAKFAQKKAKQVEIVRKGE
jgi:hypothetical protein